MNNQTQREFAEQVLKEVSKGWQQRHLGHYWENDGDVCLRGGAIRVTRIAKYRIPYAAEGIRGWFEQQVTKVAKEQFPDRCWRLHPQEHEGVLTCNRWVDGVCGHRMYSVPVFNDHKDTTIEDIKMVLEKVISDA